MASSSWAGVAELSSRTVLSRVAQHLERRVAVADTRKKKRWSPTSSLSRLSMTTADLRGTGGPDSGSRGAGRLASL